MPLPSAVPAAAPPRFPAPARPGAAREGAVAGLVAGVPMLAWLCGAASTEGLGWRQPLEAIGIGVTGWAPGAGAALAGLGLHALAASALGALFAALVPDDFPTTSSIAAGAGYGLLATGIMMSVVVPTFGPGFRDLAQPIGGSWVVAQVLHGSLLGFAYGRLRRARGGPAAPAT